VLKSCVNENDFISIQSKKLSDFGVTSNIVKSFEITQLLSYEVVSSYSSNFKIF